MGVIYRKPLVLLSIEIRKKRYGVGREITPAGVFTGHIKVKAGAAVKVGGVKECIFWLAAHGLTDEEAYRFVSEGLEAFDKTDQEEKEAGANSTAQADKRKH